MSAADRAGGGFARQRAGILPHSALWTASSWTAPCPLPLLPWLNSRLGAVLSPELVSLSVKDEGATSHYPTDLRRLLGTFLSHLLSSAYCVLCRTAPTVQLSLRAASNTNLAPKQRWHLSTQRAWAPFYS